MKRNQLTERFDGVDRAVSPVIGVILMVAITVILAAVIGTFVLDLGQSAGNSAPSASLTVDTDANQNFVNVSHKGGDALNSGDTRVVISNDTYTVTFQSAGSDLFSVGDDEGFFVSDSPTTTWELTGEETGSQHGLDDGFQYDVQIIDTESQRVIFETTVTA